MPATPEEFVASLEKQGTALGTRIASNEDRIKALEESAKKNAVRSGGNARLPLNQIVRYLATGKGDDQFRDEAQSAYDARDMSVASASGGGYITPAVYRPEVIELLTAEALLTKMGINVITGARGKTLTIPRQTGGSACAYLAENTALGVTAPTFSQEVVSPHLAGAYSAMSRLLAENADPAAEQFVRMDLARSAALFADQTGLFGDGTGSNPTGLFNQVTPTVVGAAITLDRCLDAITAVESGNGIRNPAKAAFLMHPRLWGVLRKAKGSTNDHYILSNDQSSPTKRSIQGYPVYVSTAMEITTSGTDDAYAMVFGDFSGLNRVIWDDVAFETTNVGGDSFVKHQTLVKVVWADDYLVSNDAQFACYTDLYTA